MSNQINYQKAWYQKNAERVKADSKLRYLFLSQDEKEKRKEYVRLWKLSNRERVRETNKKSYLRNKDKCAARVKVWGIKNKDKRASSARARADRLRDEMFSAYGRRCVCCGEDALQFLTLDHVDGSGKYHREQLKGTWGVYMDLKRRGWPKDGFRILCMNCNWVTRYGEECPHSRMTLLGLLTVLCGVKE